MPAFPKFLSIIAVGCFVVLSSTGAQAELIVNGDFEASQIGAGNYGYGVGTIDGWTYHPASIGGALLINNGGGGAYWLAVGQTFDNNQVGGVQGLGALTQSFMADGSGAYSATWVDAGRSGIFGNDGAQTYLVSIYDDTANQLAASSTFTTTTGSLFNPESLAVVLNGGDSYTLSFAGLLNDDQTALIDSVSLTYVPEPASLALFATGIAGLGWMRRRKNG